MEDAIKEDARLAVRNNIHIYADGSGFEGKAGACVILYRGTRRKQLQYCLGDLKDHMVFEAEAVGVLLGLHLL